MTGPDHFREAEKILELTSLEDHYRNYHLQAAQVHATLALAAATALVAGDDGRTGLSDYDAWSEVASTAAAQRRDQEAQA